MTNVCVLMSVYNAEKTLDRAMRSILQQTFSDFEFLIIEDASTDRSRAMLQAYAAADNRIRLILHDKNTGLTASLNEGIQQTSCDYIARMDADDESFPERLAEQIRFMNENPDIAVVGSYASMMGLRPHSDWIMELPLEDKGIKAVLPKQNCLFHPSVVFRRQAVIEAGLYRPVFRSAQDYDLWLRMAHADFCFANLAKPLIRYCYSLEGITLSRKWEQLYYVFLAQVCYQYPQMNFAEAEERAKVLLENCDRTVFLHHVTKDTCEDLLRLGHRGQSIRLMQYAVRWIGFVNALKIFLSLLFKRLLIKDTLKKKSIVVSDDLVEEVR